MGGEGLQGPGGEYELGGRVQPLLLEPIRGLEGLSTSSIGPVEGVGMGGWSGGAVGGTLIAWLVGLTAPAQAWHGLPGPSEAQRRMQGP